MHEAIAEVIGQRVAIGVDDVALRFFERDIAVRGQRASALVVNDFVGRQDVVVVENFDIAARRHPAAGRVVEKLVALQVQWLRFIEGLFDRTKNVGVVARLPERTRRLTGVDDAGILRVGGS